MQEGCIHIADAMTWVQHLRGELIWPTSHTVHLKTSNHSSANDFQWNNENSVAWPWVSRTSWHFHNEMSSGTIANMVARINFRGSWDYQGVESMLYFLLEKAQIFYRKAVNWILTLVVGMQGLPDCSQASAKIYKQNCDTLELIL